MSLLVKHFVNNPKALLLIETLNVDENEKQQLTEMATLLYHQKLLNKFLERLQEEDKRLLIETFLTNENEKVIEFLREKINEIEDVVEEATAEIEEQIINDINELK